MYLTVNLQGKRVAKLQKLLQSSNKTDFLAKCQKLHNMLNIDIFDHEVSQSVSVVDYDIFNAKAIPARFL